LGFYVGLLKRVPAPHLEEVAAHNRILKSKKRRRREEEKREELAGWAGQAPGRYVEPESGHYSLW